MEIEFTKEIFNECYIPTYNFKGRYLHLYGTAGSGKSEWAAQKILLRMMTETPHRFLFYRKVAKTIRASQFQLFRDVMYRWNIEKLFKVNKSDMEIICKANGNQAIAFGLDDTEKLKSIAGITGTWGEEPTEIENEDEFTQVDLRMRGKTLHYQQHIFSYNPINEDSWLKKKQNKAIGVK